MVWIEERAVGVWVHQLGGRAAPDLPAQERGLVVRGPGHASTVPLGIDADVEVGVVDIAPVGEIRRAAVGGEVVLVRTHHAKVVGLVRSARVDPLEAEAVVQALDVVELLVVCGVAEDGRVDGALVRLTDNLSPGLTRLAKSGEQNADEHRDDRDDHQELDEREGVPAVIAGVRVEIHGLAFRSVVESGTPPKRRTSIRAILPASRNLTFPFVFRFDQDRVCLCTSRQALASRRNPGTANALAFGHVLHHSSTMIHDGAGRLCAINAMFTATLIQDHLCLLSLGFRLTPLRHALSSGRTLS